MKQKIDNLTDKEKQWVEAQLQIARSFVSVYAPGDTAPLPQLETLDRAWEVWLATDEKDSATINGIINGVGIAFGQWLVNEATLEWVVASDANSSEMAVFGLPGKGDVLVYPAPLVAKRYERREAGFLVPIYQEITAQVKSLQLQVSLSVPHKPWWRFW